MTRARDLADSADKDIAGTLTLDAVNASGVITGLTVEATGDTAAGDNAAMGYTAAEGLILTGQGSTSDITLKNDADAVVFTVPTGTDDILFPDNAKAMFGAGSDLQIYHDGSHSYIDDTGTGELRIRGHDKVKLQKYTGENFLIATADGSVTLNYDNAEKLATTSTGIDVTGTVTADGLTVNTGVNSSTRTFLVDNAHSGGSMYNAFGVYVGATDRLVTLSADYGESIMAFKTNGAERMRIDSSGRVGIGATPSAYGSSVKVVQLANAAVYGVGQNAYLAANNYFDGSNNRYIATDEASRLYQAAGAFVFESAASGSAGAAITFSEKMRIDSSGNVGIGVTPTANYGLLQINGPVKIAGSVASTSGASAGVTAFLTNSSSVACLELNNQASTGYYAKMITNGGSQVGSISYTSSATSYTTSSDYRLKTDAQPMTGATERIKQLNPVNFEWIADGTRVDGFLAHEAQAIVPEAVTGTKDEVDDDGVAVMQGIDQSKLVPLLVKTIQELEARIRALEG